MPVVLVLREAANSMLVLRLVATHCRNSTPQPAHHDHECSGLNVFLSQISRAPPFTCALNLVMANAGKNCKNS